MRDEAHVGFVDPHAEGDGGDHHHIFRADEGTRIGLAHRGIQPGMVSARRPPAAAERGRQFFGLGAALRVDDARTRRFGDEAGKLLGEPVARRHRIAYIGSIEPGEDEPFIGYPELGEDVGAGMPVRRRGQREAGNVGPRIEQAAQHAIIGAEIMPPFGHAMCLVDRDQRELGPVEQAAEAVGVGALGRHIEQIEIAIAQPPHRLVTIVVGRCERGGADARRLGRAHLIVHQRDQRRDDQPGPRPAQSRDLIGQRFARAGRHHGERILPRHDALDHIRLTSAETMIAEGSVECFERGGHGRPLERLPPGWHPLRAQMLFSDPRPHAPVYGNASRSPGRAHRVESSRPVLEQVM
jgi:hypothetical protein